MQERSKYSLLICSDTTNVWNIIEGKVLGNRERWRLKKPYLEDFKHLMQINKYSDMKGTEEGNGCDYKVLRLKFDDNIET